jgi:small subunit ribosomal protein S6
MSKTKSDAIPLYELLYMIPNKFTEDELKPIVEKVNQAITEKGGKITFSEAWGSKRLAYPIKSMSHAYYNLLVFETAGEQVAKIDRALRMMSEIMRHQIVIKKVKTEEAIAKEKKIAQKIANKKKEEIKLEETEVKIKKPEKVDLEQLDEKLDKILDTDDLL